jgi:hypothetical protein
VVNSGTVSTDELEIYLHGLSSDEIATLLMPIFGRNFPEEVFLEDSYSIIAISSITFFPILHITATSLNDIRFEISPYDVISEIRRNKINNILQ